MTVRIGVIGGSGVYQMEGLKEVERVRLSTPFGSPSDEFTIGNLSGQRVAFLARHGVGHRLTPTEVPSRANIYAFKSLGVERLISLSAVGSYRQELAPLDIVIPDQLVDRTVARPSSFFGSGVVVHVGFADPFCPELRKVLVRSAQEAGARVHDGGTLVVMEGPQFSTKGESRMYRELGMDLIGMTALPEAKLAREAEICYATVAMVTDYDVWHPDHDAVTVDMVVRNLIQNAETGKRIVSAAVIQTPAARTACGCGSALATSIITRPDLIPNQVKQDLSLLLGKYIS